MSLTKQTKPKIILWDIETTHNIVAAFDLYGYNPFTNILQEKYIISAAWTELGSGKIESVSVLNDPDGTDFTVVKKLLEVFKSTDAVVAHYGDKFDMRFFYSRVAYWGLTPPAPVIQIDTYKIAKKHFKLNSYRLDYIGKYFNLGRKSHTRPGLWLECLAGKKKAIREMVVYNRDDIYLLEKVYRKLAPFTPAKLNSALITGSHSCPNCGSTSLQQRGYRLTTRNKYQRYQCNKCGKWSSATKAVETRAGVA